MIPALRRAALVILLTGAVAGAAAWVVFFSPLLGVREIEVTGGSAALAERVRAAAAELVGQRLDAIGAAGQQRDAVAVGGQRAGCGLADARRAAGDDRHAAGVGLGAHADTVPTDQMLWAGGPCERGTKRAPQRQRERSTVV